MSCRSKESPFSRDAEIYGSAVFKWPLFRMKRISDYFPYKSAPEKGKRLRKQVKMDQKSW
jgi:hypothetical protein